ncbi:MAG TPA: hypothetical protein ENI87_09255 [bacterium]|nr:hypothetical protein [bacterium]
MTKPSIALSSTVLLLAGAAAAQVPVPAHAPLAEGHAYASMPFGRPGFRTQIVVDGSAIAPNGALLTGLRLRGDRVSAPLAATLVPNVTITLSHTSVAPGAMSTAFASNITSSGTVVFQGAVQLPAVPEGFAGPLGWDIVVPLSQFSYTTGQGNLLIDIVGNNPAGQSASYYLDAERPGGASTQFGDGPPLSNSDYPRMLVFANGGSNPTQFVPGSVLDLIVTTTFSSPPGVMAIGTSAPAQPIDLSVVGAPGSWLYVDPIVIDTLTWQGTFIGWNGITSVNVPNQPSLVGTVLYAQGALADAGANALGMITTEAAEIRLGTIDPLPMQQLDASDPAAANGTLLTFGFGTPTYGAVPLLLEGSFF